MARMDYEGGRVAVICQHEAHDTTNAIDAHAWGAAQGRRKSARSPHAAG